MIWCRIVRAASLSSYYMYCSIIWPSKPLHCCIISNRGCLDSSNSYSYFLARQNREMQPVRMPLSFPDWRAFEISFVRLGHFSG